MQTLTNLGVTGSLDRLSIGSKWLRYYVENITGGTLKLNQDFQGFIESFLAHKVRFLIVGGYALAAHGHPRYTKDLDVWVWVDPDNSERIIAALEEFGFGGLGLSSSDFLNPDIVVQLGREPQRIDILTFATGLEFAVAYEHRILIDIGGLSVPFLSVGDLRKNKLSTGRLRDQADAAELPPPPK